MFQVAILDDYTNAALTSSDWDVLPDNYKITVFNDNLIETDALVKRLTEFDIVCAMRERTPFTSEVFNALPNLKLFVTTGMRNAAVDIAAANKNGVTYINFFNQIFHGPNLYSGTFQIKTCDADCSNPITTNIPWDSRE